ncbi:galactose-specific lectin nattectin-like [Scomber scombrus]|uniref:Galactose-specific lectin nattectin-like n=1 Tax=Scomber scombrus TaxID=13677 RepID=A0AAV1Q4C3_SCOSC
MASGIHLIVLLCLTGLWIETNAQCGKDPGFCEVCPSGWTQFERHCYIFYNVEKDWADAERACTSLGGNLASLPNSKVYGFIRAIIHRSTGKHLRTWVGGYDAVKMASNLYFILALCGLWIGENANVAADCHVCPPGWTRFEHHCYMFNHVEKDWADAEHACTSHGGNLASLPNTKVYNFIRAIIHASTGKHTITWVGGYDATKFEPEASIIVSCFISFYFPFQHPPPSSTSSIHRHHPPPASTCIIRLQHPPPSSAAPAPEWTSQISTTTKCLVMEKCWTRSSSLR